ncbi:MAG: glycosyltransferase [Bacteroidales bacterium]|nr:glycosyltransferase [Bacteroidales bacterium]
MKIVLVNTYEHSGGAAIACNRLRSALEKQDVDVKMLVMHKTSSNEFVLPVNKGMFAKLKNKINFLWERFVIFIVNGFSKKNVFVVSIANSGSSVCKIKEIKDADIIHLHWINQGMISLRGLRKIAKLKKPIVWTMHDQWAYTGICHHANDCKKYETECNSCPKLKYPSRKDLSFKAYKKKQEIFKKSNITLVGCSNWITNCAKNSNIGNLVKSLNIPNPINIDFYKKIDKETALKHFGLPNDKKIVLFGAFTFSDENKGLKFLIDCVNFLSAEKDKYNFVVFGGKVGDLEEKLLQKIYNVNYISDKKEMVLLYSAVDVFLIPSIAENLPNVIMESMSCSTPCVGFNVGGIPEMIDHKKNGYIAEYKNAEDLANGVRWVLENDNYKELSENARLKVETMYNEGVIAKRYIELYNQLLKNN